MQVPSILDILAGRDYHGHMERVNRASVCYSMSRKNKPVIRVNPQEPFCFETMDAYGDRLLRKGDSFTKDMWSRVNPATGPVFIEGASRGDILCVDVMDIKVRGFAAMFVERNFGALGRHITCNETKIYPIRRNALIVNDKLSLRIKPMIGVIGTAPEGRAVLNGTPGEHGGNMDCGVITRGTSVYLPVGVKGALLCAGDIHALMGDGEVCICGAEVSGEITLKARIARFFIPTPCVETSTHIYFISSAKTLDEAEHGVLEKTFAFLNRCLKLKPNEAARIMSLTGDLQVCQVVDPLKTMRFALPKQVIKAFSDGKKFSFTFH